MKMTFTIDVLMFVIKTMMTVIMAPGKAAVEMIAAIVTAVTGEKNIRKTAVQAVTGVVLVMCANTMLTDKEQVRMDAASLAVRIILEVQVIAMVAAAFADEIMAVTGEKIVFTDHAAAVRNAGLGSTAGARAPAIGRFSMAETLPVSCKDLWNHRGY